MFLFGDTQFNAAPESIESVLDLLLPRKSYRKEKVYSTEKIVIELQYAILFFLC